MSRILTIVIVSFVFLMLGFASQLDAATWGYDFGTGSDSYTTDNTGSDGYLQNQPSGGGIHRVNVGNGGGGGFYRDDQGLPSFGASTELRIVAPTTTGSGGINKYAVRDYTSGGQVARTGYMRTYVLFGSSNGGNADSGTFYFFWGDGASFADNTVIATDEAMVGMRFVYGSGGTITTSWMVDNAWTSFTGFTFQQGQPYILEFFASNGNGTQSSTYTCNGQTTSVTTPAVDLWVNGTQVGDELGNAWTLNKNVAFDSFEWYGEGSTGNVANLFLDSMNWSNDLDGFVTTYYDYYSKSTGNLDVLANWGTSPDGSGVVPTSFTTAGITYHIQNNATPTIGANWTVSGAGSNVILGDGVNGCTFTVPSAYTMTGTIHVNYLGILNLQNTTYPTFGTLYSGSTVRYSATGNQTVNGTTYYDISIQGTGIKTLGGTTSATNKVYVGDGTNPVTLTVPSTYALTGTVDVNAYGILNLEHYSLPTLGTLAANSTVRYSYAGDQSVTGTTYYNMDVDNGFTKTMQNDVTVTNLAFANNGTLALNSYDLTLAGKDISFYSTNAVFSDLSVGNSNQVIAGVSLGPIWTTYATFTNSVDVTFRYSTALSTSTTIGLWYSDSGGMWTKSGDITATDGGDGYMYATITGLTTLGSMAKGPIKWTFSEADDTLPVELSSFTAVMSATNYVQLQWVTQSETNVSGYRLYRHSGPDLEGATMLNTFIQATNTSQMQVYVFWDEEVYESGTYYYWLQNLDFDGGSDFHGPISITVNLDNSGSPVIPLIQGISSVYPNPFNPNTSVKLGMLQPGNLKVAVYNMRGQVVRVLFEGFRDKGTHTLQWDGTDANNQALPSGMYVIRMTAGTQVYQRKAMLMK